MHFPICFENYNSSFADLVRNIAPVFGGINLEDIAAPRCFEVEEALQDIGIPVMHDDQHGTAIVVLAALLNACKVTGKEFEDLNIVICGAGAAGLCDCAAPEMYRIQSRILPHGPRYHRLRYERYHSPPARRALCEQIQVYPCR